jgi:hypothetical protein
MTWKRLLPVIGVLCLAATFSVVAVSHYCYVLVSWQRSNDRDFVAYRIDDARRFLLGKHVALLINTQERVVLSVSPTFGRRIGPVVLWPRDSMRGVVLGDGLKGDEGDSYRFVDDGVDIHCSGGTGTHDLHVTL